MKRCLNCGKPLLWGIPNDDKEYWCKKCYFLDSMQDIAESLTRLSDGEDDTGGSTLDAAPAPAEVKLKDVTLPGKGLQTSIYV